MGCVWSKQRPLTQEEIASLYQRNFEQAPLANDQTLGGNEETMQMNDQPSSMTSSKKQNKDQIKQIESSKQAISQPSTQNAKVQNRQCNAPTDLTNIQSQQQQKVQPQQDLVGQNQGQLQIRQNIGIIRQNLEINSNCSNQQSVQDRNRQAEPQCNQFQQSIETQYQIRSIQVNNLGQHQQIIQNSQQQSIKGQQQKIASIQYKEHYLIVRYFEIQQSNQTIKNIKIPFIKQEGQLQISDIDQIITKFIIDEGKFSLKMNIKWLLEVYNKIINDVQSCQNSQDPNYEILRQIIQPDLCESLLKIIGKHFTTLLLNARMYKMEQRNESRDVLLDKNNLIANDIYELIFAQPIRCNNNNILNAYLKYLNNEVNDNDRSTILDQMLKRELVVCNEINLMDNSAQLKSLQLLNTIAEYPFLIDQLLLNSWAFLKSDSMKTGKDVQNNTIIGRSLSYSSFPKETHQSPRLFENCSKNGVEEELDVFRVKINQVIDAITHLLKKLLTRSKTRESTVKLINHFIFLCLDIERTYMLQLFCPTHGFIHNFTQVLLGLFYEFVELSKDISTQSKQLDLSLIKLIKYHPLLSKIYAQQELLSPPLNLQEVDLSQINSLTNLITIIYLFTQRALKLQVYTLETYMNTQLAVNLNNEQPQLLSLKYAYDIQLLDKMSIQYTMKFLFLQSRIGLDQIKDRKPDQCNILPNMFVIYCHSFIRHYFTNNELTDVFYHEVSTISEFMCKVMCNQYLINDLKIRALSMKIIYFLVLMRQVYQTLHINVQRLLDLFIENENLCKYLIEGLINTYVDTIRQYQDKDTYQFIFCQIINYLFKYHPKIYTKKLNEIGLQQNRILIQFMNIYLSQYISLFDKCLEKMKRMKELESLNDQLNEEQKKEYQDQFVQLGSLSNNFDEYQQHFLIFNQQISETFITEKFREQFVGHLNDVIIKLTGPSANTYKTSKLNEVKFDSNIITVTVVQIILAQSHHQFFLEEIVKDKKIFFIDLLKNLKNAYYWDNILPLSKLLEFDRVIMKLIKLSNIDNYYETLEKGAPKEIFDPIFSILITDPVKLPNSKVILDRVTIQQKLLENQIDPFDQTHLTEDMLIELPQLKLRINKFIRDKMCKIQRDHDLKVQIDLKVAQIDNIPEQFKDALNNKLMLDPYTLPSSRKNIDRTTMDELFKNSQQIVDPINITPLRLNMMISNVTLKKQINAFLESERNYQMKKLKVKQAEEERLAQQFIMEQQQNIQPAQPEYLIQNQNPEDLMINDIDNQMSSDEFQDNLLSKAFQINTSDQTILKIYCPFVILNSKLSVDIIADQLILKVLTQKHDFTTQIKVNWLLQALHYSTIYKIKQNIQDIQLAQCNSIINSVCRFLTTLIIYPQNLGIQQTNEDRDVYQDLWNITATHVYLSIFDQSQRNFKISVLRNFVEYLSQHINIDDTTLILDLMLKRELANCTNINIYNSTTQKRALNIINEIVNYPILIEPLILNSWAFIKVDKMKTGKEIQNSSILGRSLSLTTFPSECSQLNALSQAQIELHIQAIRSSIIYLIDAISKLLKRLLAAKSTKSKILTFLNRLIYLNLNMNSVNPQLEEQNNYSTCGFINNFVQVVLRLCQAFMSSKDIILLKSLEINNNCIVALQQHRLLANLYENNQNQNMLQNQNNQNQIQPQLMTLLYLLALKALNLQTPTLQTYKNILVSFRDVQQQNKESYQKLVYDKYGYEISLFDLCNIKYTINFLCFECAIIYNQIKDKVAYESSLIIFLEDLYSILSIYTVSYNLSPFLNEIQLITEVVVLIVRYEYITKSNVIRYKGIELLNSLLQQNQANSEIWKIFIESKLIQDTIFESLYLVFHENRSKSIGDTENCNQQICQITACLLQNHSDIYAQKFIQNFRNKKILFDEFVASTKCSYLILSLILMGRSEQLLQQTNKRNLEIEESIKIKYAISSKLFLNFKLLTLLAQDLFKQDEVKYVIARNLNFMLGLFDNLQKAQHFHYYQQRLKVEIHMTIASIIEIYINLGTDEGFLKHIVQDKEYKLFIFRQFSIQLFQRIKEMVKNTNILNVNKIMSFQNIIEKLMRLDFQMKYQI